MADTQTSLPRARETKEAQAREGGLIASTPALAVLAALAALIFVVPALTEVWRTGRYFDTDDAMRMVQVRDLLAGQHWFDLLAHRLDPPQGMLSHWSRIVDVPLAAMIFALTPLAGREHAELLTRIAFPLLLHVGYFVTLFALARRLAGDAGVVAAFLIGVLASTTNVQFMPGRIDHHAPQILLLAAMALACVKLFDGKRRWAIAFGCLVPLSLAISIENLPFIAVLLVLVALSVARDDCRKETMEAFGLSLFMATPTVFAATVPSQRWFDPVADAFGFAHVTLLMIGGLAVLAMAMMKPQRQRWIALAILAVIAGVATTLLFPYLLRDPLVAVDPLVRDHWLAHVHEARPLWLIAWRAPAASLQHIGPLLAGLTAAVLAWRNSPSENSYGAAIILALVAAGCAASLWQVRAVASTLPFVTIAAAIALAMLARHLDNDRLAAVKAAALGVLFCVMPWNSLAALLPNPAAPTTQAMQNADACFVPNAYDALAKLPRQQVLSSLDMGSYVLAHTHHDAVAAAYHRNNRGNHILVAMMLADPKDAAAIMRGDGARLLAVCPAAWEIDQYARAAPNGLAAALRTGIVPSWLTSLDNGEAPIRLFAIR